MISHLHAAKIVAAERSTFMVDRRGLCVVLAMFFIVAAVAAVRADTPFTDKWFLRATAFDQPKTARQMSKPDFWCGKSFGSLNCHIQYQDNFPVFYGVWQLIRYDRKHNMLRIGSTLDDVIAAYGPPQGHGQRFATMYTASFPAYDKTLHRHETLNELLTVVIDHDVVTSISINIQCCNG